MNEPCCCYFANDGPRWRWMDDPAPATPVTAATLVTPETPILRRRRRVILTACGLAAPTVKDHFRSAIPLLPLHFRLIIQSVIKSIPFGSSPGPIIPKKILQKSLPVQRSFFKKSCGIIRFKFTVAAAAVVIVVVVAVVVVGCLGRVRGRRWLSWRR